MRLTEKKKPEEMLYFNYIKQIRKSKSAGVVAYIVKEVSLALLLLTGSRRMILDKTSQQSIGLRIIFR